MVTGKNSILSTANRTPITFAVPFYVNPNDPTQANDYNTNLYLNFFIPNGFKGNRDSFYIDFDGTPYDRLIQIKAYICDGTGVIQEQTRTEPFETIDNGGFTPADVYAMNYDTEQHYQFLLNTWVFIKFCFDNIPNAKEVQLSFTLKNSTTNNTVIVNSYPFVLTNNVCMGTNRDFIILESDYTGTCAPLTLINPVTDNIRPFDSLGRAYNTFQDIDSNGSPIVRQFKNRLLIPAVLKQLPNIDEYEVQKLEGTASQNKITKRYQIMSLMAMPTPFFLELQTILERIAITATVLNALTGETETYNLIRETTEYAVPYRTNVAARQDDYWHFDGIFTEAQNLINFDCCNDVIVEECTLIVRNIGINSTFVGNVSLTFLIDGALQTVTFDYLTTATESFTYIVGAQLVSITHANANTRLIDNPNFAFEIVDNCNQLLLPTPPTSTFTISNNTGTDQDVSITTYFKDGTQTLDIQTIPASGAISGIVNTLSNLYYLNGYPLGAISISGAIANVIKDA